MNTVMVIGLRDLHHFIERKNMGFIQAHFSSETILNSVCQIVFEGMVPQRWPETVYNEDMELYNNILVDARRQLEDLVQRARDYYGLVGRITVRYQLPEMVIIIPQGVPVTPEVGYANRSC
jgi:hypothetical protein